MNLVTQVSKEQIERLQKEMAAMPQSELVTEHSFSPGMYLRKVYRPAGTLIVGITSRFQPLTSYMSDIMPLSAVGALSKGVVGAEPNVLIGTGLPST